MYLLILLYILLGHFLKLGRQKKRGNVGEKSLGEKMWAITFIRPLGT